MPALAPQHWTVRSVSRSHVGLVRAINEDRVFDAPESGIWAVADGMGGHRGGDIAAQTVIDRLRERNATGLVEALSAANTAILTRNEEMRIDAGATVVAAAISEDQLQIVWAGDSRAYHIRGSEVRQLTHDHTVVQELVDAGLLTVDLAERHPQSHVVTRALGVRADPALESVMIDLRAGDRLLLCSDGLSRSLRHADLASDTAIEPLADRLVANALERDGGDNVSLVIVEIS